MIDSSGKSDYIFPLGKVNIFIGTNNSGKSRLARGILMIDKPSYLPVHFDYESIQKTAFELKKKCEDVLNYSNISEINGNGGQPVRQNLEKVNPSGDFGNEPNLVVSLMNFFQSVQILKEAGVSSTTTSSPRAGSIKYHDVGMVEQTLYQICFGEYAEFKKSLTDVAFEPKKFDRLYIPIIRGLRPAIGNVDDIYEKRTVYDYFSHENKAIKYPNIKVFSGLGIYSAIKLRLLGSLKERQLVEEYEKYLSSNFFEGKPVTVIPREGHDVLTIKIGNEVEKEIFNVGDGLQSLIAITFPLFEHAKQKKDQQLLVCIEEPELLVHPSLQRTLMNELLSSPLYKNIQFFVTTHSNHFLDLTLDYEDVSIFRVRKELEESNSPEIVPKFLIENVSNKDKQTLELLGVKNSSVFLSNATIWVEGITDRMYIRHAFNLWQHENKAKGGKVYREDAHYSFVEYSGANLSHWNFIEEGEVSQMSLQSIVSHIFLIADNDKDEPVTYKKNSVKTKKDARLDAIKEVMGDNFYRLKKREIENLIAPNIIKSVAKDMGATKGLDSDIIEEAYKDLRMGDYLHDTFGLLKIVNKYGAINNKKIFADKVLSKITNISDLSPEMITICRKIEAFIEKSNEI